MNPLQPVHTEGGGPTTVALVEPAPAPVAQPRASLYRVFWRWHFYSGVLVAPVLLVVAITGALYIFKADLERVMYPNTMFVTPRSETVPLERQVAAVEAAYPGSKADTVEIDSDPTRATSVRVRGGPAQSQRVYVNQHTGAPQGSIGEDSFFRVVLDIHRRLFVGTTGRVVVETVTCWTIVLLATGLYLWFPRRATLRGVLVPRLWAKPYTVLRDVHAVAGACLMPVAVTIASTGLLYSLVWGSGYSYASSATGAATSEPPKSVSPSGSPLLPLDRVVGITRDRCPGAALIEVRLPTKPDQAIVTRAKFGETSGSRGQHVLALDRSTGAVIDFQTSDQYSALRWWRTTWNYPLHVGSVLGTPTKVIWLIACLVLAALPVTGLWMWWKRRPTGKTGFPRRPTVRVPLWLIGVIVLLGVFLPLVGASVLVILLGEWVVRLLRRWGATVPESQAA